MQKLAGCRALAGPEALRFHGDPGTAPAGPVSAPVSVFNE